MTLWILFCRMNKDADILLTFYAKDREDAEQRAEEILKEYRYERLDLKAYPCGFRMVFTDISGKTFVSEMCLPTLSQVVECGIHLICSGEACPRHSISHVGHRDQVNF